MKVATPKGKQKPTASAHNLIFCFFTCLYPWWMTKLKIVKQSDEQPNWKLWNRVVNDQTKNHETKWSEKEAGACWS